MERTQILLDTKIKREIKTLADREGVSFSEIVRQALKAKAEEARRKSSWSFFEKLATNAVKGPGGSYKDIDKIVYGL